MQKIEIQAEPRMIVGRASKTLRTKGTLPAVLYGNDFSARNIQVSLKDFKKVYAVAGESTLIYVKLEKETYPSIIHDVATDALHDTFLHADFYKVRLDQKIHAKIPVVFVGESSAVKDLGGILVKNINEVEVEGLPQDLPHQFDVDISALVKFQDEIKVKDLKVPTNLTIDANPEEIIVLIQEPISEAKLKESLETSTTGVEDVKVIEKEKKEAEVGDDATPEVAKEEAKK